MPLVLFCLEIYGSLVLSTYGLMFSLTSMITIGSSSYFQSSRLCWKDDKSTTIQLQKQYATLPRFISLIFGIEDSSTHERLNFITTNKSRPRLISPVYQVLLLS